MWSSGQDEDNFCLSPLAARPVLSGGGPTFRRRDVRSLFLCLLCWPWQTELQSLLKEFDEAIEEKQQLIETEKDLLAQMQVRRPWCPFLRDSCGARWSSAFPRPPFPLLRLV